MPPAHCLLHRYASDKAHFPDALREVVNAPVPESAAPSETFARELLRRTAGGEAHENDVAPLLHDFCAYRTLFTTKEATAAQCDPAEGTPNDPRISAPVFPAQVAISGYLPPGLTDALIREANCSEPAVGLASVTVDRAGRVQRLET